MKRTYLLVASLAYLALAACDPAPEPTPVPAPTQAPSPVGPNECGEMAPPLGENEQCP